MGKDMKVMDELRAFSTQLTDLSHIMSLLQWDQEVMMPPRGTKARASQLAALSRIIHQRIVSPELRKLLDAAEDSRDTLPEVDRALVRVMRRQHDQNRKLPEPFVAEFSALTSQALAIWVEARQRSDYNFFKPLLQKIIRMSREKAEFLGYAEVPYDALLDLHEEGLLTAQVTALFDRLKPILIDVLSRVRQQSPHDPLQLQNFSVPEQIDFSRQVLKVIGYDFDRGRQDRSAHPFSTSLGHDDRRVTNRYDPATVEFIFTALHEGGHALYEQGVAPEFAGTHLDEGISLGIHESQSRLWENIIGRSRPFWQFFYPALQKAFPAQFNGLSAEDFYRAINIIRPGFIRVEADEVSYNLHVLIRFELETALIDSTLTVDDLPVLWQEKYGNYLDVSFAGVADADAKGVLQDVHWAHGSFGYFPTYTIGNLAAAQFWDSYCRFDPDYRQTLASGNLKKIRDWLRANIYSHGAVYTPEELLTKVTGEKLSEGYFLRYLNNKFRDGETT
jgi:carboxypeptidase Taq